MVEIMNELQSNFTRWVKNHSNELLEKATTHFKEHLCVNMTDVTDPVRKEINGRIQDLSTKMQENITMLKTYMENKIPDEKNFTIFLNQFKIELIEDVKNNLTDVPKKIKEITNELELEDLKTFKDEIRQMTGLINNSRDQFENRFVNIEQQLTNQNLDIQKLHNMIKYGEN